MTDSDEIFMEELREEFKESVANYLVELPALYAEGKFEEISRIAHDIKGTSGVFGYDEGTEIAKELQYAAQDKNAEETKRLLNQLADYMKASGVV